MAAFTIVTAQRGSYAGTKPILYGDKKDENNGLNNRFGDDSKDSTVTPPKLDANYFSNYYNSLPVDQQPFWWSNREHIQQHLNQPEGGTSNIFNRGHFQGRRR